VEELSQVLHNIKMVAKELRMKSADKIGWGLIKSCMSDQASTQKLSTVWLRRVAAETDTAESVMTERDAEKVLKLFYSMHLGVNCEMLKSRCYQEALFLWSGFNSLFSLQATGD